MRRHFTPDALDAALPTITLMLDRRWRGRFDSDITLKATSSYLEPITVSGVTKYCPEIEPSGSTTTIIGSSFVRSQVVIYDIAGSRVGFAPYAELRGSLIYQRTAQCRSANSL